ncbi:MAG: Hypothetical protein BHV28_11130 [Candidatus Tokpelaia hoelldobleri]|uniref:UPF0235 protein BHV28_11130 n=1 Tax=Candidatus Tokpelaia hoelldobleri TaxID=1902579 RepID=A0A1U9JVC7_9HYPH|nr:MAG: Hypothetical protein BHV28_11130 [Candidatus Tokpelaia hoelldoblerii]
MFYREEKDGLTLFVRLTPKAAKDTIVGVEETGDGKSHLSVRIRAVPEDGKANKALIKFLAKEMKIPASAFQLAAGATARLKQLHISGHAGEIAQRFADKLK